MLPLTLVRTAGLPLDALISLSSDFTAELSALKRAETRLDLASEQLRTAFDNALESLPSSDLRTAVYNARRMFFVKKRLPATLPAPLPPALSAAIDQWQAAQNGLQEASGQLALRYATCLQENTDALKKWSDHPSLRRSLLFASHDLLSQIADFQDNKTIVAEKKQRRLAYSLAQYVTRGAAKTSPFSRLTTLSVFNNQERNDEEPAAAWQSERAVVSPNVALLPLFYEALLKAPSFRKALPLAVNPSLTIEENGKEAPRYKWLYFDGVQESFQHMYVHPLVGFVLSNLTRPGPALHFDEIVASIERIYEGSQEERETIVGELIDTGLLEWQWPERGFSPSWCGKLYQFLGFLPGAEPLVVEAAALLQWLRTAARVLPHQEEAQALDTLRDTASQLQAFFEQHEVAYPGIAPEQLFYEDVEAEVQVDLPAEALDSIALAIKSRWQRAPMHLQTPLKARLHAFARQYAGASQEVPFMMFSEAFIREKEQDNEPEQFFSRPFSGKIGALIQVFRENNQWRAVVNGLFPGGGKLWVRWLHLFTAPAQNAFSDWWPKGVLPYPWQHWSNADFQSQPGNTHLAVPGGRTPEGKHIRLNELWVRADEHNVYLYERRDFKKIDFTDLGLEAPDSRPPVMQILWQLGVPRVSKEVLLDGFSLWQRLESGALHRPRVESGLLVLERAAWQLDLPDCPAEPLAAFLYLREKMEQSGVPRHFFARFSGEKPQFMDQDSPVLMQLLIKKLHQHGGNLYLEEMLPGPEHSVVRREGSPHAAEFVIEFEV